MKCKKFFFSNFDSATQPLYSTREGRNEFLASYIKTKLKSGSILNIGGGGERFLERYLGASYGVVEVDMQGDCDHLVNLEEINEFEFGGVDCYDLVAATDVLEHLDNFHLVLSEMIRVSRKYVLISLPNGVIDAVNAVAAGEVASDAPGRGAFSKFYGLPITPPIDRHKWWFSWADVVRLVQSVCEASNLRPTFFVRRQSWRMKIIKYILPVRYYTIFCPTFWVLLEKTD